MNKIIKVALFFFIIFTILNKLTLEHSNASTTKVNVGYYTNWSSSIDKLRVQKILSRKYDLNINWVGYETIARSKGYTKGTSSFGLDAKINSGLNMIAGIAANKIDIAFANGVVPFIVATSKGFNISTVGIATEYKNYYNCNYNGNLNFDIKNNIQAIKNKNIVLHPKNADLYSVLKEYNSKKVIDYLNINNKEYHFENSNTESIILNNKDRKKIAMFCNSLESLATLEKTEFSKNLFTENELNKIGIINFDLITVNNNFLKKNQEIIIIILNELEKVNIKFHKKDSKNRTEHQDMPYFKIDKSIC